MLNSISTWIVKHLNLIISSIIAILAPITPIVLTLSFLIFIDFVFGIYRAYKMGDKITSRKMSKTVSKILLYNLVIICLHFLEQYILETGIPLDKLAASLIAVIELKSIDESWSMIFGWSIWHKLVTSLERGKSTTKNILKD